MVKFSKVLRTASAVFIFNLLLVLVPRVASSVCNNKSDTLLPQVFVYNASAYDAYSGKTPNYDTNGTITFKTDGSGSVKINVGIECRHNLPIKWVFDGNFASKGFREIHTNCSRTLNGSFEDSETYQFLTRYEFEISNFNSSFVFLCQVIDKPCEKRAVVSDYNETMNQITFQMISNDNIEPYQESQLLDFETKLNQSDDIKNNGSESLCTVNLTLSADSENIFFDWEPLEDNVTSTINSVLDPQSFENYFRFVDVQKKECTNYFDNPNDLPCMSKKECRFIKHKNQPHVFHYIKGNEERVVKGFLGVTEETKFYFSWDEVNPLDLIYIHGPSEAYIGQEIEIKCHASPIHFSHGTLIGWNVKDENNQNSTPIFANWRNESVFVSDLGTRNITGKIQLDETLLQDLDNNVIPGVINVSCYAPKWDSTEWVVKSLEINLLESERPSVEISQDGDNETLICEGFGTPLPTLKIIPPREDIILNFTTTTSSSDFPNSSTIFAEFPSNFYLDSTYEGIYNCVATSVLGTEFKLYEIKYPGQAEDQVITIAIILGVIALTILLLIVVGLLVKRAKSSRGYQIKMRNSKE